MLPGILWPSSLPRARIRSRPHPLNFFLRPDSLKTYSGGVKPPKIQALTGENMSALDAVGPAWPTGEDALRAGVRLEMLLRMFFSAQLLQTLFVNPRRGQSQARTLTRGILENPDASEMSAFSCSNCS